jgi:hypothetical protein
MPLRNLHIWFRYSWLCYHSNCQFYFPPLHIHCSASGLPFILIYSLVVSAWKRLNLIMNETALKVGPDCLLRVRRAIWTDLGSAIFFMPWWNHFENPQTPLVLPGNMGEAIGAWIDDSENEIFTVNYANYVFFAVESLLSQQTCLFAIGGMQGGCNFTWVSCSVLKPVFHWRRDGNSDIQLTGYIVIYHQIVAWKLSLDHKLDVYWTCFGRYFELAEGKKPYTHWI